MLSSLQILSLLTTSLPRGPWLDENSSSQDLRLFLLPYLYMDLIAPQLSSSVAIDSGHRNEVRPVISKKSLLGE